MCASASSGGKRPVGSWKDCQVQWWKNVMTAAAQHALLGDVNVASCGQMSGDMAAEDKDDVVDAGSAKHQVTSFVADEYRGDGR